MGRLALLLCLLLVGACSPIGGPAPERRMSVLIFSHTTGYRHDSIEPGKLALKQLVEAEGALAVLSEDPAIFAADRLAGFDAIVFLSTTTDPSNSNSEWLSGDRVAALQAFLRRGGGVVAIHAAADSHYFSPWYGALIGARFRSHPPGTPAGSLAVVDPDHPSTRDLPREHRREDEWYAFRDVHGGSRLLITLDPRSIGGTGGPSPISWTRHVEGGRVFYTALGHTSESYGDPYFLAHVRGGLRWVLGRD